MFIVLRDENFSRRMSQPGINDSFAMGAGAGGLNADTIPPSPKIELADISAAEAKDASRDPSVVGVTRPMPTTLIEPFAGDAVAVGGSTTWGVQAVGAPSSPFTGQGVKVAVLDTGIDPAHPAFQGMNLEMKNFSGGSDNAPDGNGHGTHCAGTVFGRDVGGQRIGVAPGVTDALIGKVLGDTGGGSSEMLFDGMQWAQREGAKVISMSLGFDFPGLVERLIDDGWPQLLAGSVALEAYRGNLRVFDAIMAMFRAMAEFDGGTVVVAASGNESRRQLDPNFEVSASLPSAAEGIISVGALAEGDDGLTVADFSNTNPVLSAPGVGVISAEPGGGLVALNGTSMACPHVAGLAALWWEGLAASPIPLTHKAVKARLRATAVTSVFAPGVDITDRGDGLAQAPSGAMS